MKIIEALAASEIKTLTYLNLSRNQSWWKAEGIIEVFCDFAGRQEGLTELILSYSKLQGVQTSQLLGRMVTSRLCSTLEKLDLHWSCDFSQDEACESLASLLE